MIPTMDQMRNMSQEELYEFHLECAFYHGYTQAIKIICREHGDDPALAITINSLMDMANADMAAECGA